MEENAKGGGNKGMMLIIVGMLALIIVALAGVAVMLIISMGGNNASNDDELLSYYPEMEMPGLEYQLIFNLTGNISTTLGGTNNMATSAEFGIGINNTEENHEDALELYRILQSSEVAIVAIVTDVVRQFSADAIDAEGGREALNADILTALQNSFTSNLIVAVYTNFNVFRL